MHEADRLCSWPGVSHVGVPNRMRPRNASAGGKTIRTRETMGRLENRRGCNTLSNYLSPWSRPTPRPSWGVTLATYVDRRIPLRALCDKLRSPTRIARTGRWMGRHEVDERAAPARRAGGAPLLAQSYPLRCISPLQNSGPPRLLIDIPAHGLGNPALEIFRSTPTELALEL